MEDGMKCHICGKSMRAVKTEVLGESDMYQSIVITWRCDHCDGVVGMIRRATERAFIRIKSGRVYRG